LPRQLPFPYTTLFRSARRPVGIRDGERDGVGAVVDVAVARLDARARGPVAEAPGIRDRVPIRIRRAAAVERDGGALRAGVGAPRRGRARVFNRGTDEH